MKFGHEVMRAIMRTKELLSLDRKHRGGISAQEMRTRIDMSASLAVALGYERP